MSKPRIASFDLWVECPTATSFTLNCAVPNLIYLILVLPEAKKEESHSSSDEDDFKIVIVLGDGIRYSFNGSSCWIGFSHA
ncbi:hypothetical protein Tco_0191476, partial [Tanacetum coccineum]